MLDICSVPNYNQFVRYRTFMCRFRIGQIKSIGNALFFRVEKGVDIMNRENDVILSVLKLSRAMRRCPPDPGAFPFPPAAGRLLECVAENSNVSPRELCELMDVRPSSLSEMLSRAESEGWIIRATDEEDRRIQRISLSPEGQQAVDRMREARKADYEKKTGCFTEEEKAQFCRLANRLSDHMESLAADLPEYMRHPPRHGRPPFPPEDDMPDEPRPPRHGKPPILRNARIKC